MKGFLQGGFWGVVLGVSGLSIASLVGEQPQFAQGPAAPQLSVPALNTVAPGPAVSFEGSSDETPQFAPAQPLDAATDVAETAPDVSTEPASLPQAGDVATAIEPPETVADSDLGSPVDAPTVPRFETALVAPPAEGNVPVVKTAPADVQPAIPEAPEEDVASTTAVEQPDVIATDDLASADTPAPQTPETPIASAPVIGADEAIAEAPAPVANPDDETQSTDVIAEPAQQADEPETRLALDPVTPSETPEASTDTETDLVGDNVPQTEAAVVAEALPQTTSTVRINRPGTTVVDVPDDAPETPAADAIPEDAPALLRYGVPFAQAEATALIAIVLVDEGQMSDAPAAVADLGFVATVAVNALSSASTDLAAAHHAAGAEIAMQAVLPAGAQPTDVEVAFEAALGLVPEAGILFSDGTGAMQDRVVTAQVMEILASDGYGFVTVQRGLSNAARTAEQAGVPAITIQRDIDGAGEDRRAILRALDQAAFRARQTGQAVLLGRMTPDTLAALKDWAADVDRDTLAIAPVSAVLLQLE
ncbi:divergent polysaccharide deacetylase family protein [Yoonia sp. GPGPB17]|uniref:divergent polysaccharide deacetylase family protein n=1 Tax=Yoonia sp. GPGPB17 TaxID=3026147 RepID=UPI0030BCA1B1